LVEPAIEEEPPFDASTARLLDEAEDIVNAAGPAIVASEEKRRESADGTAGWWQRFGRPFRRRP
jgi:hypothetical protein